MSLKKMKKEELELMTHTDLTELILLDNKKPMNTAAIFRYICNLFKLSDDEYTSKIGAFYTSLTLDKRFMLLESAEWDLRDRHVVDIVIADDEDEFDDTIDVASIVDKEIIDEDEEETIEVIDEDDLDDDDDGLEDLVVIDEDELEAE